MTRLQSLVGATLIAFLLAGCTSPADDHANDNGGEHAHDLGPNSFELKATGMPAHVESGEAFTFTLTITSPDHQHGETTHLGAHYWAEETDDPNGDFGLAGGCNHVQGAVDVPGTFEITCSGLPDGTNFVRGHLRLTQGDDLLNYWSAQHAVHIGPMG